MVDHSHLLLKLQFNVVKEQTYDKTNEGHLPPSISDSGYYTIVSPHKAVDIQ